MTKATYEAVARTINSSLRQYDDGDFKPRVSVVMFAGEYHLFTNNEAFGLTEKPGHAQDLLYADNTYVVGDEDIYIEPAYGTRYFGLAIA